MRWTTMIALAATSATAQIAGPPVPPPTKTPAEQSIARANTARATAVSPRPCRPATGDTITVCGAAGDRSPYRLPLSGERDAADGARIATGDAAHVGIGRGSTETMPNTGVRLTLKRDQTTLKGLGQ